MVESIKELRKLCQKKIILFNKKGEENTAPPTEEYFYDRFLRLVSIYITKLFLYTPLTSNQVTILSMFVGLAAGISFTNPRPLYWFIGFLLLQLFHFLDAVDGEIARYRKDASPIGKYFDLMAHGVVIASFYAGITIGIYNTSNNPFIFLLGFICLITFSLNNTSNYLKNYIIYEYIIFENGRDVLKKIKSSGKEVSVSSARYIAKRILGFDGLAFFALGFALLDWFLPLPFTATFSSQLFSFTWRLLFLSVSALAGLIFLVKKMASAAQSKKELFD